MSFEDIDHGGCRACAEKDGNCDELTGVFQPAHNDICAKIGEDVLQVDFFVEMAEWLNDLNIDVPVALRMEKEPFALPLLRWMVAYVLYGGIEKGITYRWPCGCMLPIEPETVDEVFDQRKTVHLPVAGDWSAEKVSYDRGVRFWIERAVAGEVTSAPRRNWAGRLILLDLVRQTLNSELFRDG